MVLELNSTDYKNLKTNYSEPNIISRISGNEYLIDNASVTNFYFDGNVANLTKTITPTYSNLITRFGSGTLSTIFTLGLPFRWGRSEVLFISGDLTAEINDVIYDKNSISINYELDYDTYKKSQMDFINGGNYNINGISAFSSIRTNEYLQNKDGGGIRQPQTTSNNLFPHPKAILDYAQFGFTTAISEIYCNFVATQFTIKNIVVDSINGKTTVTFHYAIPVWYGWNYYREQLFANVWDNNLNVVKTITLSVQANTINITENDFEYGNINEEPYSLESNEFLQYMNGDDEEDKLSYDIAQEIFTKTEKNRMIVTFDLHRLERYAFDGGTDTRYISSRDRIKIKDELGNYIGQYYDSSGTLIVPEFEVIRANGKWDGRFYKEIVAKEVYNE